MPRPRWANRLIVFAILALPIAAFFILQAISASTRAGNVSLVWLVTAPDGKPVAVALDGIGVGARLRMPDGKQIERGVRTKWRLVQVDLRNGERLGREGVEKELELFAVTEGAFWFHDRRDGADPHARDPETLERLRTAPPAPSRELPPRPRAVVDAITRANGERLEASALDQKKYPGAGFLIDERTGAPVDAGVPGDLLVVHGEPPGGKKDVIHVVRLAADGTERWTTRLERQRIVLGATRVENDVVLVSGGPARDFAFSLSLQTGERNWLHTF